MFTLSIDPGLRGALAIFEDKKLLTCISFPIRKISLKKSEIDISKLAVLISKYVPPDSSINLVLENVYAFPGQGVVSVATLTEAKGTLRGLLHGLFNVSHEELVRPSVWKKDLGLDTDKKRSLELSRRLFPDYDFKNHNEAEAALLGWWFNGKHGKNGTSLVQPLSS